MRRPPQEGQNARPLHENPTTVVSPHLSQRAAGRGLAFPLVFVLVYLAFARWTAWMADDELPTGTVARLFVLSLVPIAIAYHLAHYFTYLLIQGQLLIRLASDPLGFGWNLFGTARYRPDIGIVGARAVWYTAVIAIVLGHVIAVYVAHVVALREFRDRRAALRTQLPMRSSRRSGSSSRVS